MEDLDTTVLRTAHRWLTEGQAVVLVTVARTWGSSPRPPGSLMALNGRGETVGSVSGGCIEDDLIHRIREGGVESTLTGTVPTVLRYGISADQAHRFGLPCGGTVELVLERVTPHSRLDELLVACEKRESWNACWTCRAALSPCILADATACHSSPSTNSPPTWARRRVSSSSVPATSHVS